jgi:mannan endo-1,4-beta-mannosidase
MTTSRWKPALALGAAVPALVLSGLAFVAQPAEAATGIRVSGTNIVEKNGNVLVLRGTSHAHTWFAAQTGAIANISALGANSVRVVLSGGRWGSGNSASDVANIISLCKANKVICMLEYHDTTGYGEQSGATTLAAATTYWNSIKSVLVGQEDYVIINIGNEPYGNVNPQNWTTDTVNAVKAMRTNGFQHALVVDAPGWGQDKLGIMRDNARTVESADTMGNTIFSVHMYGVYGNASTITSYISTFKSNGLPLIIGEFAFDHSDGNVDEDTIMSTAVSQGVGYYGWSWSGNSSDVGYLDQVTSFNPGALTTWGTRLFNGTNGIRSTAKRAAIFGATTTTTTTTTKPATTTTTTKPSTTTTKPATTTKTTTTTTSSASSSLRCTVTKSVTSSWSGAYQASITVKNTGTTASPNPWKLTFTLPSGQTFGSGWGAATVTASGTAVTATGSGSLAAGASAQFTYQANASSAGLPSSFALNGTTCT